MAEGWDRARKANGKNNNTYAIDWYYNSYNNGADKCNKVHDGGDQSSRRKHVLDLPYWAEQEPRTNIQRIQMQS